ncbi:hypothetical protein D1872_290600 [compost metagenome]
MTLRFLLADLHPFRYMFIRLQLLGFSKSFYCLRILKQVVVGISDTILPHRIFLALLCYRQQQLQCLIIFAQIVVGSCQMPHHIIISLSRRNCRDRLYNLIKFIILMPLIQTRF